jgi:hypothetical protein
MPYIAVGATALRHEADAPAHLRGCGQQIRARDRRMSAVRLDQRGQHAQGGGLSGSVRAQKAEDLAALHGEVHAAHRVDRLHLAATFLGPVRLAQAGGLDHRVSSLACRIGRGRVGAAGTGRARGFTRL